MSLFMKVVGNPFMKTILRTPLHPLLSKSAAVLTVTGRKSGEVYSFPVNCQRDGELVWISSMRDRSWWKNLRGGARVSLRLAGKDFDGWGEVYESQQEVQDPLKEYLRLNPAYAKYFKVGLDGADEFKAEDLAKASEDRVMVRVTLS